MSMELGLGTDFLKELQNLQSLYKSNFDLLSQRVEQLALQLETANEQLAEANEEVQQLQELLKEVIAEKDVQIQRLLKVTAALTVVTDQITERFSQSQQ